MDKINPSQAYQDGYDRAQMEARLNLSIRQFIETYEPKDSYTRNSFYIDLMSLLRNHSELMQKPLLDYMNKITSNMVTMMPFSHPLKLKD